MDCNNTNKNIHQVELARTFHFMTFFHISLFPMVLCMSLFERPVSDKWLSTYVIDAGLPLDLDHCVGSQNSSSFATPFPSHIWPENLRHFTRSVSVTLWISPYKVLFTKSLHKIFSITLKYSNHLVVLSVCYTISMSLRSILRHKRTWFLWVSVHTALLIPTIEISI